jgi:hypothetical protein
MRFVLKAIFFLAVVAAFLPRQLEAEAAPQPAMTEPAGVETAAGAFCDHRPALCQTAEESAFALRVAGDIAVAQARQMIAEAVAEPVAATPAVEDAPAP